MNARTRRAGPLLTLLAVVGASLASGVPRQEPRTAPWPRQGGYAGPERCASCHDFEAGAIAASRHRDVVHSAVTMGCETCHGPGAIHAIDEARHQITHPQKLAPRVQAALCGRCHRPEADGHAGGGVDGFLAAGLGCTDCHWVHEEIAAEPVAGVRFRSRAASLAGAEPVETERCVRCHPTQGAALSSTGHAVLGDRVDGCATCHGNGSLHVATGGIARLVTRPDRAADGVATCVACHDDVDPERAHWPDGGGPFLGDGLGCTDCHAVHGRAADPDTGDRNAACATCHATAFAAHIAPGSVHGPMTRPGAPLSTGCGACHAGAAAHARDGGDPSIVESLRGAPRAVVEQTCLACHGADPALRGLHVGSHARRDVSCTACHAPSAPRGAVVDDAERRCATCHPTVGAAFRLPNRHPVGAGGEMHCSDCHDPHAARPRLRDTHLREERCVECHRAYRGPFVFEHQASRVDGCVACHLPHGSSNRRMLKQADTQQNCIACHGDFPSFHDQTSGSVFTNCLNCHTQVHGSDHSRFFFR